MKKILCLLLAGLMLAGCAACDDGGDDADKKKVNTVAENPACSNV